MSDFLMKRLTLQDLGALLRLSGQEPTDLDSKLIGYDSCESMLPVLLCGYAHALRRNADSKSVALPQVITGSSVGCACAASWRAQDNRREADDEHGTRTCEAYPIIDRGSFTCQATWHPFESRCARSIELISALPKTLAKAIGGVLSEMTDNVVQHSGANSSIPARAVATYFATENECGFGVVDSGRGALASLRSNPAWAHLRDETDALAAILTKGATRKPENSFGDGYRALFRAIVDHEFQVVMWSGAALTTIEADHGERREVTRLVEPLPGFAVALIHRKNGA